MAVLPEEKEKKSDHLTRARLRGHLVARFLGWLLDLRGCFACFVACSFACLFLSCSHLFSETNVPHHPLPPEVAPPAPLNRLRGKNSPERRKHGKGKTVARLVWPVAKTGLSYHRDRWRQATITPSYSNHGDNRYYHRQQSPRTSPYQREK